MKSLSFVLSLVGSLVVSSAMAQEPVVLKFAHDLPETMIKAKTIRLLAEKTDEYSNGTLKIEIYPGAQLVSSKDEVRAVIRGQVDMVAPLTSYYVPLDERWEVFNQPGLFTSFEHSMDVFENGIGRELLGELERFKVHGIGMWHDGPGYIFTSGDPVIKPADMAGRKLRVTPSAPLEEGVRILGAMPVSLPAPDVYLALQQGLVNGGITTVTLAASARWYEVLNGMTRVLQQHGGYIAVMNKARWDKLSDAHREALEKAMKDATEWNRNIAAENAVASEKTLTDNGVTIHDLDDATLQEWKQKYTEVYAHQPKAVQELIARIQAEAPN